jgi:hypothetical protein
MPGAASYALRKAAAVGGTADDLLTRLHCAFGELSRDEGLAIQLGERKLAHARSTTP